MPGILGLAISGRCGPMACVTLGAARRGNAAKCRASIEGGGERSKGSSDVDVVRHDWLSARQTASPFRRPAEVRRVYHVHALPSRTWQILQSHAAKATSSPRQVQSVNSDDSRAVCEAERNGLSIPTRECGPRQVVCTRVETKRRRPQSAHNALMWCPLAFTTCYILMHTTVTADTLPRESLSGDRHCPLQTAEALPNLDKDAGPV